MQYATLDIIIRRTLLEKGLPLHWYAEFMLHASAAIRELSKDTLKIINTVNLPLNSYNAVDLPHDFVDDVMVGIPVGGLIQPIPHKSSINPLRVHDATTGVFEPYTTDANIDDGEFTFFGVNTSFFWYWNVNDYGEPTGRYFGANGGANLNGYKVVKERRQIQFTGTCSSDDVILQYISNGQNADNATQVDWLAHSAIQAFINWKRSPNADIKDSYEAGTYYNEKRILRANLNPMTTADVKQILRSNYTAAIKS